MLSRRSLFPALAAAAVSVPALALAEDYTPVPDVYLARSEVLPVTEFTIATPMVWKETWRHTVDSTWVRYLHANPELSPYAQRHTMMLELYKEDHRR